MQERWAEQITTYIAGRKHYPEWKKLWCAYYLGDKITLHLEAEPDNPHDPLLMAIKVMWGNKKVGYLPASNNEEEGAIPITIRSEMFQELDRWDVEIVKDDCVGIALKRKTSAKIKKVQEPINNLPDPPKVESATKPANEQPAESSTSGPHDEPKAPSKIKTCLECGYTGTEKYCPECRKEKRVLLLRELPPKSPDRALVLRINGLGDVIMSTVLCRYYHRKGVHTTLGTQPKYIPLMQLCPDVDTIHAMSYPDEYYSIQWDLDIKSPYQFDFHELAKKMDRIDLILKICGELELEDRTPRLIPTEHEREIANGLWRLNQWDKPVLGLSLVSESHLRTIGVQHWPDFLPILQNIFPQYTLISFGDDPQMESEIKKLDLKIQHLHNMPLRFIAAVLQNCTAVISVDSGLMHLSAAVGTPTIGLFGEEIRSSLRVKNYPTIVPVDYPDLRLVHQNWDKFDGLLVKAKNQLATPRRTSTQLNVEQHNGINPLLLNLGERTKFYRDRPASDSERQEDRTKLSNYEYPRVKWVQENTMGPRVIDIGTAGGQITRWFVEQGWITDACEPNKDWAKNLHEIVNGEVFECFVEELLELDLTDRWNTVVMSDMIEHLYDPYAVVAGIVSRWRPDRLLITTPIGHWDGSDEHLWEFTKDTIHRIADPMEGTTTVILDRNDQERWFGIRIDRPIRRKRGTR